MNKFYNDLIGCKPDFIKDELEKEGYDINFTYTRGFKDKELLTEEYAVRINCMDKTCNITLSCFNTMI